MNTQFQKKAGRRWTWRSPDGNTKNEIDCIITDKPSMITDVTVINRVNISTVTLGIFLVKDRNKIEER